LYLTGLIILFNKEKEKKKEKEKEKKKVIHEVQPGWDTGG